MKMPVGVLRNVDDPDWSVSECLCLTSACLLHHIHTAWMWCCNKFFKHSTAQHLYLQLVYGLLNSITILVSMLSSHACLRWHCLLSCSIHPLILIKPVVCSGVAWLVPCLQHRALTGDSLLCSVTQGQQYQALLYSDHGKLCEALTPLVMLCL